MDSSKKNANVQSAHTLLTRKARREGEKACPRANGRAETSLACAQSAGSLEDLSECGDQLCEGLLSSASLLYSAPSCIEDFTERWITEVMRQYYSTQLAHKSPLPNGIESYSVEMAGNNEIKSEEDDEVQVRFIKSLSNFVYKKI